MGRIMPDEPENPRRSICTTFNIMTSSALLRCGHTFFSAFRGLGCLNNEPLFGFLERSLVSIATTSESEWRRGAVFPHISGIFRLTLYAHASSIRRSFPAALFWLSLFGFPACVRGPLRAVSGRQDAHQKAWRPIFLRRARLPRSFVCRRPDPR